MSFAYITTPIYYVNDKPHLGHFYTTVAADILTRFYRMAGKPVKFLTGTDEHGAKVAQAAAAKGISPQAYVDQASLAFRSMVDDAQATPDDFIRTTQERHQKAAQALWTKLESKGQIYLGSYEGWYAVQDEAFYPEGEIIETPQGKRAPTGALVEWIQEPCYFFRLSAWQDALLAHYQAHPEAIAPESRYNETLSFIQGGLKDLAVSRSKLSWGVPVPGAKDHVMYVWIDALTNYITALGYPEALPAPFWPQVVHLVGKDILRFHTVYWPAFLMAADLPPPARVMAHGWWTRDGQKMSKSLGNVIDPHALVETYGADAVRYFLFRHIKFGQDGDFSENLFIQRFNQELADGLGNLVHRTLSFLKNHGGGVLPSSHGLENEERALCGWGREVLPRLTNWIDQQDIHAYLEEIYKAIQRGNQYMAHLAPWALVKQALKGDAQAQAKMESGLYAIMCLMRDIAILIAPIMPEASRHLLAQLGQEVEPKLSALGQDLVGGCPLPPPSPLFKKVISEV